MRRCVSTGGRVSAGAGMYLAVANQEVESVFSDKARAPKSRSFSSTSAACSNRGRSGIKDAHVERIGLPLVWPGLPDVVGIASVPQPLAVTVTLRHRPEEYAREVEAVRFEFPELVWQREGKPDKFSLGSRVRPEDWARYGKACPKILAAAEQALKSLPGQDVEVAFGDVLDYRPGNLLGWHQDSMAHTRHTFTVVLTLFAEGDGRFEWRSIAEDGLSLGAVASSVWPRSGELTIHGLACNNAMAHRVFWDTGRRVTLVLFCKSKAMEAALVELGIDSHITMRHWWTKTFETNK